MVLRVAVGTPEVRVANVAKNTSAIKELILSANGQGASLLVLPELCITGATCGDLFWNNLLVSCAKSALLELANFTKNIKTTVIVGLPFSFEDKLYNCAAVLENGKILKIMPKTDIPSPRFSDQARYFENGKSVVKDAFCEISNLSIPFDASPVLLNTGVCLSVVLGDGVLLHGVAPQKADIIVNLAAINQTAGITAVCQNAVENVTAKFGTTYVLASSGVGESTTDAVYAGLSFIAQGGKIFAQNEPFSENSLLFANIDIKNNLFAKVNEIRQENPLESNPFLPSFIDKNAYLEEILQIQSHALARRIAHTHAKKAVIGISGGLDSTLALLVTARAFKILNRPASDILCITMPCFGTTTRTRSNSEILSRAIGADFREINIKNAVLQHFSDIGHDETQLDVTYENSQARERTQVLMDVANKENGIVIGTGDLSELVLGWATYNGDHMSMYGVNSGLPKTLIRHIVEYEANNFSGELKSVLFDVLNTPVSPELLPADKKGEIAQKTEDLVGPYELHDFFIYHMLALRKDPAEIFSSAISAFPQYDRQTLKKWLSVFTRRFFTQQFKRSCLPDGPKVLPISVSPRTDLKMPSDASFELWLEEIEKL